HARRGPERRENRAEIAQEDVVPGQHGPEPPSLERRKRIAPDDFEKGVHCQSSRIPGTSGKPDIDCGLRSRDAGKRYSLPETEVMHLLMGGQAVGSPRRRPVGHPLTRKQGIGAPGSRKRAKIIAVRRDMVGNRSPQSAHTVDIVSVAFEAGAELGEGFFRGPVHAPAEARPPDNWST